MSETANTPKARSSPCFQAETAQRRRVAADRGCLYLADSDRTKTRWSNHLRFSVSIMLYGLVVLLLIVAVALFLAKVAVGGGIIGIIALILLVWVVLNAPKRV